MYITGDLHGEIDIDKLSLKYWKDRYNCTELVILGDFGLIFNDPQVKTEKYWLDWLNNMPWTTLFIDGNHENFDLINKLPIITKYNGKVGVVSDKIYHLRRGEIYNINNNKIFCFGGAESIDKHWRILGKSWWNEEIPSISEQNYALDNLEKIQYNVDYVFTHTAPLNALKIYNININILSVITDSTTKFLQHIYDRLTFKKWFCGHLHADLFTYNGFRGPVQFLYRDVIKL